MKSKEISVKIATTKNLWTNPKQDVQDLYTKKCKILLRQMKEGQNEERRYS